MSCSGDLFPFELKGKSCTYMRLLKGINCSPGLFHYITEGVIYCSIKNFIDDLLIGRDGVENCNRNLGSVLGSLRSLGLGNNSKIDRVDHCTYII